MTITKNDIVFLESKRMTDTPDGGGEMTARPVVSGQTGNLFPDISRLDRTVGAVEMRKLFLAIRAANADTYSGAHAIIEAPATDPRVNVFLMSLGDHYDLRADAQDSIESFVVKSSRSPLELNGRHLKDQTDLNCWLPLDAELPREGETLVLIQDDDESQEQYVRIKTVVSEKKQFSYSETNGAVRTFLALEVKIGLYAPLSQTFNADTARPVTNSATEILKTQPAKGSEYFGTRPTVQAVTAGSTSVKVDQVRQQLLPIATSERPMVDLSVSTALQVQPLNASIAVPVQIKKGRGVCYLPRAASPGTAVLSFNGGTYVEDGGELVLQAGANSFATPPVLSMVTGEISYDAITAGGGTCTYTPARVVDAAAISDSIEVTNLNRGLNWTFTLSPRPAAGSVSVAYLYDGDWYRVTDTGAGALAGVGSGTVNYDTGSIRVTLPALPELGSRVMVFWSNQTATPSTLATPHKEVRLSLSSPIAEGKAVSVTWQAAGQTKTLTRLESETGFSGDGAAQLLDGKTLLIRPSVLADNGKYTIDYEEPTLVVTPSMKVCAPVDQTDGIYTLSVGEAVSSMLSFDIFVSYRYDKTVISGGETQMYSRRIAERERIIVEHTLLKRGPRVGAEIVGSVDMATGTLSLDGKKFIRQDMHQTFEVFGSAAGFVQRLTAETPQSADGEFLMSVPIHYNTQAIETRAVSVDIDGAISVPIVEGAAAPGTLLFKLGSALCYDTEQGVIMTSHNTETGAAVAIGQVERDSTITRAIIDAAYVAQATNIVPVGAIVDNASRLQSRLSSVFFLPQYPIRPETLQVSYRTMTGEALTLRADAQGVVSLMSAEPAPSDFMLSIKHGGSHYRYGRGNPIKYGQPAGHIDYETGKMELFFNEDVMLDQVKINCVAVSTVPLDDKIIGLNSVRMPSTGMVPIYQQGNVLVIHHTDSVQVEAPTAGQVIDCQRTNLASVVIEDAGGAVLADEQYTANLEAGTVTLADPLLLQDSEGQALTPPLTVSHKIEENSLCNDVSLDGTLSFILPLERGYPVGSMVSSSPAFGDLQAAVSGLFSQKTDAPGQFPTAPTAGATNARLNDLDYPLEMDSRGAVKERWKIVFKSSTAFDLYAERRGLVSAGSTVEDFAPLNPVSNVPYLVIRQEAWGAGWQTGNTIRFDTTAPAAPIWLVRSIMPGPASVVQDSVTIEARGDVDQ